MSKSAELLLISKEVTDKQKAIVFIHGLSGHELKTWKKKGSLSLPELYSNDKDLSDFNIYSFGYPTGFFLKQYNIEQISRLLVTQMKNKFKSETSIYFITHSQGGIIGRRTILHLLEKGDTDEVERIQGIVYFAVPFGGALGGTLMKWSAAFIPSVLGRWIFSIQGLSLSLLSDELSSIRDRWAWNYKNKKFLHLQEKVVIGEKDGTVSPFSARPDQVTDVESVDENHRSVCKFDSKHMLYDCIKRFITISSANNDPQKKIELDKELASKADEYFRIQDYKKALDEYIHLVGKIKSKEIQVHIKHQQGICHYYLADETYDKKENYLNNSVADYLEAIKIAGDDASYSLFKDLGDVYFELSSIRNAVQYLEKSKKAQKRALEICDKMLFLNDYLLIQNNLAITYLDMAEHKNIKENVGKAINIFKEILDQDEILKSLAWMVFNNIGRCNEKLANLGYNEETKEYLLEAIKYYSEALKIVDMVDSPDNYILLRTNQGNSYISLSQLTDGLEEVENALKCFYEVLEICKKETKSFQYCRVLNNLGITYFQFYKKKHCKDDLIKAINYYQKSLEHKEISERPIMHGRTQMNYGISLFHLAKMEDGGKNLDAAIQAFDWSIKLSPDPNSNQNQAARSERSKAFIEKGLLNEDVKYINLAINDLISLIEEEREINVELNYLHYSFFRNLTDAYIAFQKIEKDNLLIIPTFERASSVFSEYNHKAGMAYLSGTLGMVYQKIYCEDSSSELTKLNSAKYYFQIAAKYHKELQNKYYTSLAIYNLANSCLLFYFEEHKIEYLKKAEEHCGEALKYIKQSLDEDDDQKSHELHRDIQEQLSVIADHNKLNTELHRI